LLVLAGAAAIVVVGLLVAEWPGLVAHWRCSRLDEARTFDEALPTLEALAAASDGSNTGGVLLGKLGIGHPRLTVWFFAWADTGQASSRHLLENFGQRLEADEKLLACWSEFVRWREGAQLGSYLDGLAPPIQENQDENVTIVCGTTSIGIGVLAPMPRGSSVGWKVQMSREAPKSNLRVLGIAWFLGMWPLPKRGPDCEKQLASWLAQSTPFRRLFELDESRRRCKRESEAAPLPELAPYSERDFGVPDKPLANWVGAAPDFVLEPTSEITLFPNSGMKRTAVSP
jgi:hypothetical protein